MTHTPGPWRTVCCGEKDPRPTKIASTHNGHGLVAHLYDRPECRAELEANARLIAAAPELLAACEQAEYWLQAEIDDGGWCTPEEMLRVLRTAIARAKGDQP